MYKKGKCTRTGIKILPMAIAVALQAAPAAAQPESRPDRQRAAPALEEVVVTARKREETFQDVPVVVSVFGKDTLERTKMDDLYGLATRVPSMLLGNAVNSTGTLVSLRGVGTTTLNATMDQSISLNVDGVPLSQGVAFGLGMFDLGQVEVLKGPQALFFGKNNTGGVISLRSSDPTDESEFIVRTGYEVEAEEKEFEVILSGPVSDSLKLRLAAHHSEHEGYFKNTAEGAPELGTADPQSNNYAPTENTMLRATALFEPNDRLFARLKLNYEDFRMDGGNPPLEVAYCPDGTAGPIGIDFIGGDNCSLDGEVRLGMPTPESVPEGLPNNYVPYEDRNQMLGSLEVDYSLNDYLTLTSVTGFYDNDYETFQPGSSVARAVPFYNNIYFDNRQYTQELRLTSDNPEWPVNFMLGGFYLDAEQNNRVRIPTNQAIPIPLPSMLLHVTHDVEIESMSLFGQVMWDITPELELSAGARWTDEKRTHEHYNLNPATAPVGPVERLDPELNPSNVSPEVTLKYQPNDNITAFASYKTGFKSGSFTTQAYIPPTQPASFEDEEAEGFEAGLKAQMLDGALRFDMAAYYYEYTDLQVGGLELNELPGGNFVFAVRTLNAASATVEGVDFNVNYAPRAVEGLTLTAALNLNNAEYDDFNNAPCGNGQTIAEGCDQFFNPATGRYNAQDLSGERLVRAPEVSGNIGFDYRKPLGNGMTLGFGAGANYTSEYSTVLVDLPNFEQDAFFKYDANISISGRDNAWEFAVIGRNLSDEITAGWCVNSNIQNGTILGGQVFGAEESGPAGGDEALCHIERGREVWARLTFRF